MSRSGEFGVGRQATPEGWVRVRANTIYASDREAPLVAIPREAISKISQPHDEHDHVLGYVMDHSTGRGAKGRALTLHTAKGATVVELPQRAWMYLHHGK